MNTSFQSFDLFLSPQVLSYLSRKSLNFEESESFPSLTQLDYSNSGVSLAPCLLFAVSLCDNHPMAVESSPENRCKLRVFSDRGGT